MNLWDWVMRTVDESRKAGRHRLAELILRIPQWATDDEHSHLDAIMPEALALARETKNVWLEVYFRHWNLQSRVLHRLEVTESLGEATRLLDFAHSEAARGCPQSICVTQDFASCFGHADGPGYVEERLAVAQETLARITPAWPCFICISCEYAAALSDAGRQEELLHFVDKQEAALVAEGLGQHRSRFVSTRADALLDAGKPQEALAVLDFTEPASDENERKERAIQRAQALAALGRTEAASSALPPFQEIQASPNLYRSWTDAAVALVKAGALPNNEGLDRRLLEMEAHLSRSGAVRKAFGLARERARLAVLRGARETALHACAQMEALVPRLRKPLGAPQDVADARALAASLPRPEVALEGTVDAVLAGLPEGPERGLDVLRAARQRWPQESRLWLLEAEALAALGRGTEAEAQLRAHLEQSPGELLLLKRLAGLYWEQRRFQELKTLSGDMLSRLDAVDAQRVARGHLARVALREGRSDEARQHLEALLELQPDDAGVALQLAVLERQAGEWTAALARLSTLQRRAPPGPVDWERMAVATFLGHWEALRESAARLGLDVGGDAGPPLPDATSVCRVQLLEANGDTSELFAERTGPVTARVLSMASPGSPQHFGDEVLLGAPLGAGDVEGDVKGDVAGEDGEVPLFPVIAILKPGHWFVFPLDGVHPGEASLGVLRQHLHALGVQVSVRSDERYLLEKPGDEEAALWGLYAFVAVPPEVALEEVEAVLEANAALWSHPMVWPVLLEKLGLREKYDVHEALMERYGIKP